MAVFIWVYKHLFDPLWTMSLDDYHVVCARDNYNVLHTPLQIELNCGIIYIYTNTHTHTSIMNVLYQILASFKIWCQNSLTMAQ
jgi:hypothetical protein